MNLDQLDVEDLVTLAEDLVSNASKAWSQFGIDQKQGFRQIVFPDGLEFDGQKFGTATTGRLFSYFQALQSEKGDLVARTVPSWNQIGAWLRELDQLNQDVPTVGGLLS